MANGQWPMNEPATAATRFKDQCERSKSLELGYSLVMASLNIDILYRRLRSHTSEPMSRMEPGNPLSMIHRAVAI